MPASGGGGDDKLSTVYNPTRAHVLRTKKSKRVPDVGCDGVAKS
jgi:hypothetical protein